MGPTQVVPSRPLTRDAPEGKVSRVSKEEWTRHRNYTNFTPDMHPGEYTPIDLPQNTVIPEEAHNFDREPVHWQSEARVQIIITRRTGKLLSASHGRGHEEKVDAAGRDFDGSTNNARGCCPGEGFLGLLMTIKEQWGGYSD
ncbi:hypothetical protein V493_03811 [Pseudogymnoascus sp. VKM F-4281 (FW-2241)]|nr:hypothetical protein V493_03811 [Pseudogymnoascus sp. VKM F-4281 (FW-2241)]